MSTAVQFGAGNIGRGFMAQLLHESGLEVVFVEVAPALLEAVQELGAYTLHIVGPGAEEVEIDRIRAVDGRDTASVAHALAECGAACTAVGAGALPYVAPAIAEGLLLRYRQGGGPLNIILCENLHKAGDVLRRLVAERLPEAERAQVLARTGFVQAVVSRMVPIQSNPPEDPLSIRAEAYKRLPVDAAAVVGSLPHIAGVEPVTNFEAHMERKLFTHNCAHAAIGYLGSLRGHTYGYEALEDGEVGHVVEGVFEETGEALIRKHGFDRAEQRAHETDLNRRFRNHQLGDTCFRLARDPLRKLAPDDRLVGAARLCESQGVTPVFVSQVIAAALCFDKPEDPWSVELQRRLQTEGPEAVLGKVSGIAADEPLGRRVLEALKEMKDEG